MEDNQQHSLKLENRSILKITGVIDVENFNEEIVIIETIMGVITISGNKFKIRNLNIEEGNVDIEGDIEGINYCTKEKKQKCGLLSKIFK